MMSWLFLPYKNKPLAVVSQSNICVCVHVQKKAGWVHRQREISRVTVLWPSAAILPSCPRAPSGSQGPNQNLALPADLLTPAVSALIKTSSTQCGPRSCTLVHTILALSTFNAHARGATYARVHTVAHHADPESLGGRNLVTFNLYD